MIKGIIRSGLAAALTLLAWLSAGAREWVTDIALGAPFEMTTVHQPDDYSGTVYSTVVRLDEGKKTGKGVLYVHGFNDYFFQDEMAREWAQHGYEFYAVDLRKYGRSLRKWQKPFQARDMHEYFADLDSALTIMTREGGVNEIVLMGHSTGGLITSLFMASHPRYPIKALVLNSPFLDWNLGDTEKLIPAVSGVGKALPALKIKQGASTAYSESLLAGEHGEWHYNTAWKMTQSPDVSAGWVRAITEAQQALRGGKADIRVPVLLMMSEKSVHGSEWTPEHNRADGVLDVNDIYKYGMQLGKNVTPVRVQGGLHDLMLSAKGVRTPLYRYMFNWLAPIMGMEAGGSRN